MVHRNFWGEHRNIRVRTNVSVLPIFIIVNENLAAQRVRPHETLVRGSIHVDNLGQTRNIKISEIP